MPYGPQKIILIRSGRYDYAEVDLAQALHIVGPNNTGKTTLINTLQFLYLDDLRRTDFGAYTHEQTRAYYFPGPYSYMLFQCLGAMGQCVLGWRGQSRASGGDPERFVFQGTYDVDDFFTETNQVREPRQISTRLARRQYRVLRSAADHRELLLQGSGAQSPGLGLVSLRDPDRYPQFRESLKDLLSLSTITQDQMRNRLLMLADIPADRVALDIRQVFGEDYDRIRQRREALLRFKKHAAKIAALVAQFSEREKVRGHLIFRWTDLRRRHQEFLRAHDARLATCEQVAAESEERHRVLASERKVRHEERDGMQQQVGALQERLDNVAAQARAWGDFVPDLAQAALTNLQAETTRLRLQLAESERESSDKAQQKVALYRDLVQHKQGTISQFDQLVVTALRRHFSDPELETLFRLISFDWLERQIADDGVEVLNEAGLVATLRNLLGRVRDQTYVDPALRLELRPGRKTLADLASPETIRDRLAEDQETLRYWERVLDSIRQREALARELASKEAEAKQQQERLLLYEQCLQAQAEQARWQAELKHCRAAVETATAEVERLEEQMRRAERTRREAEESRRQAESDFAAVENRWRTCLFPEFDAQPLPVDDLPDDFDGGIALFLHEQGQQERLDRAVCDCLRELELHFGDRFGGVPQTETVRSFQAELDALPDHEDALTRDWNAHLHGLRGGFDHILKELTEVHSAKDRLNRDFARIQISNLKSVRLEVLEAPDFVGWIRRLANMEQPGLFDDNTQLDQTLAHFRRVLEGNPILRYASLFNLRFTVVGEDDAAHQYQDFRQIESHGTTITIKVLFNLLVLKSLLRRDDSQIPFFLDEVQSLDPDNRLAIIQTARKLAFLPITAAPDAISEVDALYFLQPHQGRIVLTEQHRLNLHPAPQP